MTSASTKLLKLFAYDFESDISLEEMLQRLQASTSWRWRMRENDRWGDYLSAAPHPREMGDYAPARESMVKVIERAKGQYAFNIRYESRLPDAEEDFERLHREISERVLPELHAGNIQRTEDYE